MLKKKMISVKLTKTESEMLKKMREDHDINISSFLRKCIRKRYLDLYPEKK